MNSIEKLILFLILLRDLLPVLHLSQLITYYLRGVRSFCARKDGKGVEKSPIPHSPFPRIVRFWINKLHMALLLNKG